MRGILVLCTLIGASFALVPDMEYHYKYEGRLGLGIPEIRNKYSATGIQASVTVQVTNQNNAIFKLSDIKMGEYMGDAGIKITNDIPFDFMPLPTEWKILEEPFQVFFDMNKEEVLMVPKKDIEWVVNIRKSIAQLFLIEPLKTNFGVSKVFDSQVYPLDAFTLYEQTLFGTCSVDYAVLPVGFTSVDEKKNIQVIEKLDEDFYLMTRSVDFDKCKESVYVEAVNAGEVKDYASALNEDVTSRSSVMNIKLVGKPGQFVLKEGKVDGYYSLKPFGVSDKMMMITSQKINLKHSNKISEKLVVPTPNRVIKTLYTEISNPFAAPSNPMSFVNYYDEKDASSSKTSIFRYFTGIHLDSDYSKKCMKIIDEGIQEIAHLMMSDELIATHNQSKQVTIEGKITDSLEIVGGHLLNIDVKDLEQLFDTYYNDKSEMGQLKLTLFIDVCAANGYSSVKMIVNEMKKGRITPERITSIFSTWTNSLIWSPVIKDIMAWVKTLDMSTTHPVMTSNVFINFATILKNLCVVPYRNYNHGLIFGAEKCDKGIITQEFIPYLKQQFEATKDVFHQRSIVHALSNLATPEAFKMVSDIATGNYDVNIRETAIMGLFYKNVLKTVTKDNVFDILMPIVHDIKEDPYIRQIAITCLVSYKPSPSWWQRLAISTWKEPSESVGSFIYYLIKNNYENTYPEQSQNAKISHFVLSMTKPYAPSSTYMHVYGKYIPKLHSGLLLSSTVYKDDEHMLPRSVHNKFINNAGGDRFTMFESMISTFVKSDATTNVLQELSKMIPEKLRKIMRMAPNREAEDVLAELKKYLDPEMLVHDEQTRESHLFLRLFDNLQFTLPLNYKTVSLPLSGDSLDILKTLLNGKKLHMTKYFDALSFYSYLPTDVGLPTHLLFTSPVLFSVEGDVKFMVGKDPANIWNLMSSKALSVDMNTRVKFVTKFHAKLQVYLPWNKKCINSGVSTMKSMNLPMELRTSLDTQGNMKNLSMDIIPTCHKQCTVAHVENIPYVSISNALPETWKEQYKWEKVTVDGEGTGLYKNKYMLDKELTGLNAGIHYEGDIQYPFTWGNVYDIFHKPEQWFSKFMAPTTKYFKTSLVVDFETSETKKFHPSISFTMPSKMEDKNVIPVKKTSGEHSVFTMRLLLTGTESRYFESNFESKVLSQDLAVKRTEYLYKYIKQCPKMKPQAFCVRIEERTPLFNDYKTLLKCLTSQSMDSTYVGKIVSGQSCKDSQFSSIKGSLKLSEKMKKIKIDKITKELNINKESTFDFLEKEHMPLHDQISLQIDYKEPLPVFFTNMSYQMYDILRGSQFPHAYHNYYNMKNPKGRIFMEGEKHNDGTYDLRVELPTENVNLDSFEMPWMYKLKMNLFRKNIIDEYPILGILKMVL